MSDREQQRIARQAEEIARLKDQLRSAIGEIERLANENEALETELGNEGAVPSVIETQQEHIALLRTENTRLEAANAELDNINSGRDERNADIARRLRTAAGWDASGIQYLGFDVNGRECELFLGDAFETHLPSANQIVYHGPDGTEVTASVGDWITEWRLP